MDQELLARNEYLAAENRIMKARLKGRLKLLDAEAGIAPALIPVPTQNTIQPRNRYTDEHCGKGNSAIE